MRRNAEVSKAEERQLAVASATLGPWRTAAAVGGLAAAGSLALDLLAARFGLGLLAGSLSFGLMLFFTIGGAGAVLGRGRAAGGPDRRIRDWGRRHPWRVAVVPAGAMLVAEFVLREVLTSDGFLSDVWSGLWRGAVIAAIVGLAGSFAGRRD